MTKITHKLHFSKLKMARIQCGISQKELSDRTGIPIKTIGNLEQLRRDINHCRVDIVFRLSQALECNIVDILDTDKLDCKHK